MAAPRHRFGAAVALSLLFLVVAALTTPTERFVNDSYRYAVATLGFLGETPTAAHRQAISAYCAAEATRSVRSDLLRPDRRDNVADRPAAARQADCATKNAATLWPDDPRYVAIFEPRIGYPLLAAPLVAVAGLSGLWFAAAACTAAAGALVFALLRRWGAPVLAAAAGQVALYVSPAGQWGTWPLAEGPALLALTAAVVGACWTVEHQRGGVLLLVAGLVAGVAVKYSGGMIAATLLAGAATVLVLVRRRAALVAAIAAAVAAGTFLAQRQLGLPGAETTLQDAFTYHFDRPNVPAPWAMWWTQTQHFWVQWIPDNGVLLVCSAAALWAAGRHRWPLVAVPLAVGLATQAAFPLTSQADRLYASAWLTVAIGLPLAAMALRPAPVGRHTRSSASTRESRERTSSAS